MKHASHNLILRTRRGELNIERLVEILRTRGYITERNQEHGCGFCSSAMEAVTQDDMRVVFDFFFPREVFDLDVQCAATAAGGRPGSYAYALYNSNVISREEILELLTQENIETHSSL